MPGRDAELGEAPAGERDLRVQLAVALLAGLRTRHKQAELLQLPCEPRVDPGPLAELVEIELGLLGGQARAPLLTVPRSGRCELLPDDPQR